MVTITPEAKEVVQGALAAERDHVGPVARGQRG